MTRGIHPVIGNSVILRVIPAALLVVACSSGAPGGAGQVASEQFVDTLPPQLPLELLREVCTYRGGARDPFRSLVQSGQELRPFIEDLRVASIIYDSRYPARSLAVLRDTANGDRYDVRMDDELGHLRVKEIRPGEIVLLLEELGVPREVVLVARRRRGGNQ